MKLLQVKMFKAILTFYSIIKIILFDTLEITYYILMFDLGPNCNEYVYII